MDESLNPHLIFCCAFYSVVSDRVLVCQLPPRPHEICFVLATWLKSDSANDIRHSNTIRVVNSMVFTSSLLDEGDIGRALRRSEAHRNSASRGGMKDSGFLRGLISPASTIHIVEVGNGGLRKDCASRKPPCPKVGDAGGDTALHRLMLARPKVQSSRIRVDALSSQHSAARRESYLWLYRSEFKSAEVRGAACKSVIDAGDHDAAVYVRAR